MSGTFFLFFSMLGRPGTALGFQSVRPLWLVPFCTLSRRAFQFSHHGDVNRREAFGDDEIPGTP